MKVRYWLYLLKEADELFYGRKIVFEATSAVKEDKTHTFIVDLNPEETVLINLEAEDEAFSSLDFLKLLIPGKDYLFEQEFAEEKVSHVFKLHSYKINYSTDLRLEVTLLEA